VVLSTATILYSSSLSAYKPGFQVLGAVGAGSYVGVSRPHVPDSWERSLPIGPPSERLVARLGTWLEHCLVKKMVSGYDSRIPALPLSFRGTNRV
jgi:hypothetical protein